MLTTATNAPLAPSTPHQYLKLRKANASMLHQSKILRKANVIAQNKKLILRKVNVMKTYRKMPNQNQKLDLKVTERNTTVSENMIFSATTPTSRVSQIREVN